MAITDSVGQYIVYDAKLRRVPIFDSTERFVRSFEPAIPGPGNDVGLAAGSRGEIMLNPRDVYPLDRAIATVYSINGTLLRSFGVLSREARTVRRQTRMNFGTPGLHLVFLHGFYFLSDFVTQQVLKYDRRGRLVHEFGPLPQEWRAMG